jgi:hypothetical protein
MSVSGSQAVSAAPFRLASLFVITWEGLFSALRRFPMTLLCGWVLAASRIALMPAEQPGHEQIYERIVNTAWLGMPLFFCLHMLSERNKGWMRLAPACGILLLLAYYYWLTPAYPGGPQIEDIRWMQLIYALHFLAPISPYMQGAEGLGFWQFNSRTFLRFFLATVYSGVLLFGLTLASRSADAWGLYGVGGDLEYLGFIVVGCLHPAFFLSGVPREFDAPKVVAEYPRPLKPFVQLALLPLAGSLLFVLFAGEGIAKDGVTENGYFGMALGLWMAAWAVTGIIRRDIAIRWALASLSAIFLATAYGPWSAGTVSRNSQYNRLTKIFRERGLMAGDEFRAPRETLQWSAKEGTQVRSIVIYLIDMHGAESVHRLFSRIGGNLDWQKLTEWEAEEQILSKLNLKYASP